MSAAPRRRAAALLFVAAFAAIQALLWFAYYGNGAKPLIGDEATYQAGALSILAGGAWMPSTIWPPLQPLLLALVYAVFGPHVLAAQLLQTLLFIACAALLRDLWRRLGGSVAAANTAAGLFLLNPATAAYAHWLWPETAHLFLLLAAFCLLARGFARLHAGVAGVCVGLAMLAKSLLSAFWPAFLLLFLRRERPRLRAIPALLFVLGIALATAPALWHGWRSYGRPMIADSSVYNLWVGLTDRWRSDYVEDMGGATLPAFLASAPTPQQRNALYLDKVRALVAERGVAATLLDQAGRQYFRLFSAKTLLVSQLPGAACAGRLSVYRTAPWLTAALTALNDLFHALTLAACAFGVAGWRLRSNPAASDETGAAPRLLFAVVALFIAYQLGLMLLIHVKARFLLPMLPFLCGFAGSFLASLRACRMGRAEAAIALTPPRLAVGALLAALLLFLAFAGPALDGLCAG
jgi:4-amino-4-deoxy-L-arabinose transferase-like glycosyltransferase